MESSTIRQVIDKLVGDCEPRGETQHDNQSNANLETLCDVVGYYVGKISKMLKNKKKPEYSVKESGIIADDFFADIADFFEEWEQEHRVKGN